MMDIDDTITTGGKLGAEAYKAMWDLHEKGYIVIPITGRPAGWCDLIAREWPVHGVVGENGALVFWQDNDTVRRMYHPEAVRNDQPVFSRIRDRVLAEVPGSRVAGDQFCRMFDLAIDFAEDEPVLSLDDACRIQRICEEEGAVAKISSIHVNTWLGQYDKLGMLLRFLSEKFGYDDERDREQAVFFGDSPNDEPMFSHFPVSIGVASVEKYRELFSRLPSYVTRQSGGAGFAEGAAVLLGHRQA
jgi:hypothetical protein